MTDLSSVIHSTVPVANSSDKTFFSLKNRILYILFAAIKTEMNAINMNMLLHGMKLTFVHSAMPSIPPIHPSIPPSLHPFHPSHPSLHPTPSLHPSISQSIHHSLTPLTHSTYLMKCLLSNIIQFPVVYLSFLSANYRHKSACLIIHVYLLPATSL